MRTRKDHLFCIIRKEDECGKLCGCHGWCTLGPLLWVLKWSLNLGAEGEFAHRRHDGSPFSDAEAWRESRMSLEGGLGFYMVLCEVRGDLPALQQIVGWRAWNHSTAPCPICDCDARGKWVRCNCGKPPMCGVVLCCVVLCCAVVEKYVLSVGQSVSQSIIHSSCY